MQQYKYQRFYEVLKQCGITTLNRPADSYGLSLILGGSEVTMWDLAGVYASMARTLNHQNKNNGIAEAKDFHPPNYQTSNNLKSTQNKIQYKPTKFTLILPPSGSLSRQWKK